MYLEKQGRFVGKFAPTYGFTELLWAPIQLPLFGDVKKTRQIECCLHMLYKCFLSNNSMEYTE